MKLFLTRKTTLPDSFLAWGLLACGLVACALATWSLATWPRALRASRSQLTGALFLCMVAVLPGCSFADGSLRAELAVDTTTVYLVRHAEKKSDGRDPELTSEGHLRAAHLAQLLQNTNVDAIWSTDYVRTRSTVEPLAQQTGLNVTLYDARDSQSLVQQLLVNAEAGRPGRIHVVAGHSNTVPELVDLLESWPDTVEASAKRPHLDHQEYGMMFIVTYVPGQKATVETRQY